MSNFNEDNLIDEIQFKPLTQGLGFHHNDTEDDYVKRLQEVEVLSNSNDALSKVTASDDVVDMGQLQAFYSENNQELKNQTLPVNENIEITALNETFKNELLAEIEATPVENNLETFFEQASWNKRLFAWVVDLVILVCSMTIVMLSAVAFLGLKTNFLSTNLHNIAPLFVLLYVFYFSVLERTNYSTFGKRAFEIKVISNPMTFSKSFSRAIFTLLGLFTFGLSSILDFQSKLTDTKVVKN